MKKLFFCLSILLASISGITQSFPKISDIPDCMEPSQKEKLGKLKAQLVEQKKSLNTKIEQFNIKCINIPEKSSLITECEADQKQIKDEKEKLREAIIKFNNLLVSVPECLTVTKVYHLTAKSWINGESISEFSSKAIVAKFDSNEPPLSPGLKPGVDDYKLYQTFVVEVKFVNGKVHSANFLKESLDCRAGKTGVPGPSVSPGLKIKIYQIEGLAFVKEQKISEFGKESITFTRTVVAHSKLAEIGEVVEGNNFPDIYNTISIEVFVDKVITHGYASDFPTTYFWIGDELFAKKLQVQPADYFK